MDKYDNIINFRKNEISESEINALFLGLIKLIKKKAQSDIEIKLKRECAFATERNLFLEKRLEEKEEEIRKLTDINKTLNAKIVRLKNKL